MPINARPDMGGFNPPPLVGRPPPDLGGFPAGSAATGPDMAGFPGDPLAQYVVLLMHGSPASGPGTVYKRNLVYSGIDSSFYNHSTAGANPTADAIIAAVGYSQWTAIGLTGMLFGSGGGTNCALQFAPAPELIVGTNDFCAEAQIFIDGAGNGAGSYTLFGQRGTTTTVPGTWHFAVQNGGGLALNLLVLFMVNDAVFASGVAGTGRIGIDHSLVNTRPFHVAYARTGGIGYLWADEQLIFQGADTNNYNANVGFGAPATGSGNFFRQAITEVRLTVGPPGSGADRYGAIGFDTRQRYRWPDPNPYAPT